LEQQRGELRVVGVRVPGDPHVGRLIRRRGPAEVERRTREQPLVVGDVPAAQVAVGPAGGGVEVAAGDALVVAAGVAEVAVAGADGDQHRHAVGGGDLQGAAGAGDAAA